MLYRISLVALLALTLAAGCKDDTKPPAGQPAGGQPATTSPTAAVLGVGVVQGKVTFAGPRPTPRKIDTEPTCPRHSALYDESLVVNANGTLKNVIVSLKETPPTTGTPPAPASQPVLDQLECQYVPHVVAVQTGHALVVKSSDDLIHNVHVLSERNPAYNHVMNGPGRREYTFKQPEYIRVKCDVHPWMSAFIGVFEHPYFAVTGDDGTFELKNVPAGQYTLVAWHEKFDTVEQKITVVADKATAADVSYKAE